MGAIKFATGWKAILLLALGIVAFFAYLYLFNVDIPTIIATVASVNLSMYVLAAALVIFDTFFFSLSWHFLLKLLSVKLSVIKSFLYVWYGMFMDIIIPAESISGEISRVYLVVREQENTSGQVVASLVVQRLMGMGVNIVGLLLGIGVLLTGPPIGGFVLNLTLFLATMSTISLLLLILLCVKEEWTLGIIDVGIRFLEYVSRRRWKLDKARIEGYRVAQIFHDSMQEIAHAPKTLLTSLFFNVLAWTLSLGTAYVVFMSIGIPIPWGAVVITHSVIAAIHGIPIGIPFEAGLPEITMTALYTVMGVQPILSATATILTRLLTVWLRFFIGFAVQQGLEIKAITKTKTDKT